MKTETYTLILNKNQFELLDLIMFEEWRDYVDVEDRDKDLPQKYVTEQEKKISNSNLHTVEEFNSLYEVFEIEKIRKGLQSRWDN